VDVELLSLLWTRFRFRLEGSFPVAFP
jgi:hypothetical protein